LVSQRDCEDDEDAGEADIDDVPTPVGPDEVLGPRTIDVVSEIGFSGHLPPPSLFV
jgi:hypothetical protein